MLRIRSIDTQDRLDATWRFIEAVDPRVAEFRTRYHGLADRRGVLLSAENSGGIEGVLLTRRDATGGDGLAFDVISQRPEWIADLTATGVPLAAERGWAQWGTSVAGPDDPPDPHEELGFTPTLLVQFRGEDRFDRRRQLLRWMRPRRLLTLREFSPEVVQAEFCIDRIDLNLSGT